MSQARPITRANRRQDIAAAVGQTVFSFPFPLFDVLDLYVATSTNGAAYSASLPGAYTVDLAPDFSSAQVTFTTTPRPSAGSTVTVRLEGRRTAERSSDVTRGGAVRSASLEDVLDKVTVALQEQRRDLDEAVFKGVGLLDFDAVGPIAARTAYNAAAAGFLFLQTDDAQGRAIFYVKLSATSGDWSAGLSLTGLTGAAGGNGTNGTNGIGVTLPAAAGGTVDAITITCSPTYTALSATILLAVRHAGANTSTTPTLKPDAVVAKTIVKGDNRALLPGDISGAHFVGLYLYNATLDKFVMLNPARGVMPAFTGKRQTAMGGPLNANGTPSFLPATSGSLTLTTQNLTSTAPLVCAYARGFDQNGARDEISVQTANFSWSALAASNTSYLGQARNPDGSTTQFSTTIAPIYQWGGAASVAAGQYTFVIGEMKMYLGNGSVANEVVAVFLGEAVTGVSTVTSTRAYAYNGFYEYTDTGSLPAAGVGVSKEHNLGVAVGVAAMFAAVNVITEGNYAVGDIVYNISSAYAGPGYVPVPVWMTARTIGFVGGNQTAYFTINKTTGALALMTAANWRYRLIAQRSW